MRDSGPVNRLELGPIVGHTDHTSSCIWIRVADDPADYALRVQGHGLFPFQSTEGIRHEFGTALAVATRLRADWPYRYQVLRRGRAVPGSQGSFRTIPAPESFAEVRFVSLSCNSTIDKNSDGAWGLLDTYIRMERPHFILMTGDQVYDTDGGDVWLKHRHSAPAERRRAFAELYQAAWSREPTRTIMANTPVYMLCDDHDYRSGWGSFAPDSPTLAAQYPKGQPLAAQYNAFFEDARDAYWHFQMCHNPRSHMQEPPRRGARQAMPYSFRCGRLAVLVLDSRSERDLWRERNPVLGDSQWSFIDKTLERLPAEIEALAVVTSHPIVTDSPNGALQTVLGDLTHDVDAFKEGDDHALMESQGYEKDENTGSYRGREKNVGRDIGTGAEIGGHLLLAYLSGGLSLPILAPGLKRAIGNLVGPDTFADARDRWSHRISRPEQIRLIQAAGRAGTANRPSSLPRGVVFLGGDIHAGALFDISVAKPAFTMQCLIASGINVGATGGIIGFKVDEDFDVAEGIHAHLREFIGGFNFGLTRIRFTGGTPLIDNSIVRIGVGNTTRLSLNVGR